MTTFWFDDEMLLYFLQYFSHLRNVSVLVWFLGHLKFCFMFLLTDQYNAATVKLHEGSLDFTLYFLASRK